MCIPPYHPLRLPCTHLPKDVQRRALLHKPACTSVAKVMPTEVINFGSRKSLPPCTGICPCDRFSSPSKNSLRMLLDLPHQYFYCHRVQRCQDDHRTARSRHAPLRHRRDRQRQLLVQETTIATPRGTLLDGAMTDLNPDQPQRRKTFQPNS